MVRLAVRMLSGDVGLSPVSQCSATTKIGSGIGYMGAIVQRQTHMKVIVIGASHAGIAFVDAMRRHGFAGELTMIDRLAGLPL